jgi:hypothetical protein
MLKTHVEWKLGFFRWGYSGRSVNLTSQRDKMQMSGIIGDIRIMCLDVFHRNVVFYLQFEASLRIATLLRLYCVPWHLSYLHQNKERTTGRELLT